VSTIALPSAASTHAGSGPAPELPSVLQFDDADTPSDAIDALLLTAFVSGRQPWSRSHRFTRRRRGSSLVPAGGHVVRGAEAGQRTMRLAVGPGWTLRTLEWPGRGGEITVTATTEALAREIVAGIVALCEEPEPPEAFTTIGFWHSHPRRGPVRDVRRIGAMPWADIRDNYAPAVAERLDACRRTTL
jgi:hypothetical protein